MALMKDDFIDLYEQAEGRSSLGDAAAGKMQRRNLDY